MSDKEERGNSPRERLLAMHEVLCTAGRELMDSKNRDYGADHDPFRNFRGFGALGILVRLSDKLARVRTYLERGDFKVKDESLRDTIVDTINYAVLLYAYLDFAHECRDDDPVKR